MVILWSTLPDKVKWAQDDMPLARKITLEIWCLYFLPIDVLSGLDFRDGKSIAGIMVTGRFKILLNRILKLDK